MVAATAGAKRKIPEFSEKQGIPAETGSLKTGSTTIRLP
jgi:hypothetical protein